MDGANSKCRSESSLADEPTASVSQPDDVELSTDDHQKDRVTRKYYEVCFCAMFYWFDV